MPSWQKACIYFLFGGLVTAPVYAWEQPDNLWTELRNDFQLTKRIESPAVQSEIIWFQQHRKVFNRMARDAAPYLYFVHHETRNLGLPAELALIPMLESAYNPYSYSKTGAAGLWQIMPGTGSHLGLTINGWYDERRDVIASTKAALSYFKRLNGFFSGDWLLTIAAYDSGEGTVQQAVIRNYGQNRDRDFWSLDLPKETQKYVPKWLALVAIVKNPERYNIELPYIPNKPYFSDVSIGQSVNLDKAAKLANIKLSDLYKLNPGYNHTQTGPSGPHHLLLPIAKAEILKSHLDELASTDFNQSGWMNYHVHKGESINSIAEKNHARVSELKTLNHLRSNYVRAGTTIKIPVAGSGNASQHSNSEKMIYAYQIENIGQHRVSHIVKAHETINQIANTYHVKPNAVIAWNHLKTSNKVAEGTVLTIWTKLSASSRA